MHYQRSLEWAARVHHRPEVALTRLELAELVLAGASPSLSQNERHDRQSEALAGLDFAVEELRMMNMQPALQRGLQIQESLRSSLGDVNRG